LFELATKRVDSPEPTGLKTLLLVDDRDDTRLMTKWFLANFGYVVESARDAEEALRMFDPQKHALVITDNSMPGLSGVEMAQAIKLRSHSTPVLMYSSLPPQDASAVDLVLQRPSHLLELKDAIDKLLVRGSPDTNRQ
jgi:DNA-binding response OmpR family regulator